MEEKLFSKINIERENTHIPNGETENPAKECDDYEKKIAAHGGIDLQLLGIGRNGHIGFNEPGQLLNAKTHLTELTDDTIEANSRFFEDKSDVPTHAITMGVATILSSKKIVLLVSGRAKRGVVKLLLSDDITTGNPGSMLKVHHDVTLICDEEAYTEKYIGVDIGGKSIKIGVVENSEIIERDVIKTTEFKNAEEIVNAISESCKKLMDKYDIHAVGVGTPGIIKKDKVTASNLPFENFKLAKELQKKLGKPVYMNNDAACAALAEQITGAAKGAKNMLLITLGTGIGGGIVVDGKIYNGTGGSGEVGHMCIEVGGADCPCGKKGCWEQYASALALERQIEAMARLKPESILAGLCKDGINGSIVFEAAKQGCDAAREVLDTYFNYLSVGLESLISIFAPDTIVISGGLSNRGDELLEEVKKRIPDFENIKIAQLKNDAGIIGAAEICLQ